MNEIQAQIALQRKSIYIWFEMSLDKDFQITWEEQNLLIEALGMHNSL